MNDIEFKALIVREAGGKFTRSLEKRKLSDLPAGDVTINVKYSSLNYKDALSATGNKGVTRQYPHTPGIDAAGTVVESSAGRFMAGDNVIVTGFDLGMNTSGGFGEYIRVPEDWIVKLPEELTLKESMIFGTAGFTAALAIEKLRLNGTFPDSGHVLVTGASGGLGSLAVALLSRLGYDVAASTGKKEKYDYLRKLGAKSIIGRDEINDKSGKASLPARWGGVIDCVGGSILAAAVKSTRYNGNVAACGLTQSPVLNSTVYPLILRGVNILGIDSAHCDMSMREKIWLSLSGEWKPDNLEICFTECSLHELGEKIDLILEGKTTGRMLVNLDL